MRSEGGCEARKRCIGKSRQHKLGKRESIRQSIRQSVSKSVGIGIVVGAS